MSKAIGWRAFAVVLGISFCLAPHVGDPSDAARGANLVAAIIAWGIADILSAIACKAPSHTASPLVRGQV